MQFWIRHHRCRPGPVVPHRCSSTYLSGWYGSRGLSICQPVDQAVVREGVTEWLTTRMDPVTQGRQPPHGIWLVALNLHC